MINGIYTNPTKFRNVQIGMYDAEGRIYILDRDSYLDIQARKRLNNTYFNIKDLQETTSTINPFQFKDVISYVYPKREKIEIHR